MAQIDLKLTNNICCKVEIVFAQKGLHRRYVLRSLHDGRIGICNKWSDVADFAEAFNAFVKNCYHKDKEILISNCIFKLHIVKNDEPKLLMSYKKYDETNVERLFTKFESILVYSKLSKILAKCDMDSGEY